MKIGLLLPSILASKKYSTDRIFAPMVLAVDLANGLVDKGHEVVFYTASDIKTKAKVVAGDDGLTNRDLTYRQFMSRSRIEQKFTITEVIKRDYEYYLTLQAYQDALRGKLDIIHSFHDFGAHYFNELTKFPTLYTFHDPLPQDKNTIEYLRFSKFPNHNYVSISNSQRNGILNLNFIATVYHGIDINLYDFEEKDEGYLIYFGRIIEEKGIDLAIQVALSLKMPLKIATSPQFIKRVAKYFNQKIAPFIDGKNISLLGFLEGKEKVEFIKKAKAFVFPLQWQEPFGLTMIEAMACGVPVVAFGRGSVPELIKDGETGFVVDPNEGLQGMEAAIKKIDQIDRLACRKHVEDNFTVERMVDNYEKLYQEVINK